MLFALLVLHPHHYENSVQLLNDFAGHPKVLGVKLHPQLGGYDIMDRHLFRLVEQEIAPRGLSILSHVSNDAENVTAGRFIQFAERFPNVNFVAAHMGAGVLGNGDAGVDAWLEHRPKNVWFDLGTLRVFYGGALHRFLEAIDENQVCFGTDSPLYWPAAFSRTIETLGLAPGVYEKIAWRNALQAFPRLAQHSLAETKKVRAK
jgi:predicted TIM-barrel fold metal-dependent hydrolase